MIEKTKVERLIFEVRGQKVLLDSDLAELYQVKTKELNQQVNRNLDRFPPEFMFNLTQAEWDSLRTKIETIDKGKGKHRKYPPKVFTEFGAIMLSSILRSPIAVQMNIAIVRAFISLRQIAVEHKDLNEKLKALEQKYDHKFSTIDEILTYLLDEKENQQNQQERKRIGFKNLDAKSPANHSKL